MWPWRGGGRSGPLRLLENVKNVEKSLQQTPCGRLFQRRGLCRRQMGRSRNGCRNMQAYSRLPLVEAAFCCNIGGLGPRFLFRKAQKCVFSSPRTTFPARPYGPFCNAKRAVSRCGMCRIAMAYGPFRPAVGRFRHFVSWFACCRSVNFQHIMFTPPWPAAIVPPWPSASCRGGAARRPQAKKALPPPCFLRFY